MAVESNRLRWIPYSIGVVYALFTIWSNSVGLMMTTQRNAVHLGLLVIVLLSQSIIGERQWFHRVFDSLLLIVSIGAIGYFVYMFPIVHSVRGGVPQPVDILVAAVFVVALLEITRRAVGPVLPIVTAVMLLYARFGSVIPGMLGHRGLTWNRILFRVFMSGDGIWGLPLSVSSTYIALFILFGSFMQIGGTQDFIRRLAYALARRSTAGAAQAAMISSAVMGTISGSAAANVATTGAITIPLMKKIGYTPAQAGAIESVASTGGMIMPPIMGAAAFLMAAILGIPYFDVVKAAVMPAILYYLVGMVCVTLMTRRIRSENPAQFHVAAIEEASPVRLKDALLDGLPILSSIAVVVGALAIGRSPIFAGFAGIVAIVLANIVFGFRKFKMSSLLDAMADSPRGIIGVAAVCACAGIIVTVMTATGLGAVLGRNLMVLAGGRMLVALIIIVGLSLILTMGMPVTAMYIVLVTSIGGGLVHLGAELLAVHFFMLWYGVFGNLTPPVALAVLTASGIAGASMWKIAPIAMRLGAVGFTIPFMFVYFPALLGIGISTVGEGIRVFVTVLAAGVSFSIFLENYLIKRLHFVQRPLFLVGGVLLLIPEGRSDLIGLAVVVIATISHIGVSWNRYASSR